MNAQKYIYSKVLQNLVGGAFAEEQNNDVPGDGHADEQDEDEAMEDVAQLAPADNAHSLQIQSIKARFHDYCRSEFNFAELKFPSDLDASISAGLSTSLELDSIVDLLPQDSLSTKHLVYRIQGFRDLILGLNSFHCALSSLEEQRLNLLANITAELDRLSAAVNEEKELQEGQNGSHNGIRRVHLGEINSTPTLDFIR